MEQASRRQWQLGAQTPGAPREPLLTRAVSAHTHSSGTFLNSYEPSVSASLHVCWVLRFPLLMCCF